MVDVIVTASINFITLKPVIVEVMAAKAFQGRVKDENNVQERNDIVSAVKVVNKAEIVKNNYYDVLSVAKLIFNKMASNKASNVIFGVTFSPEKINVKNIIEEISIKYRGITLKIHINMVIHSTN